MQNTILSYNYASNAIKGYANSVVAKSEKNDCFVRAVASATGSNYDTAHQFVKEKLGRENGKGAQLVPIHMMSLEDNGMELNNSNYKVKVLGTDEITNHYKLHGEVVKRQKTVKSFIHAYPKGTFIVGVAGHAFTIKDGQLIDNAGEEFRPTRKVNMAFKITPEQVESNQLTLF